MDSKMQGIWSGNTFESVDGRLNGKTFRCSDGHKYNKVKSDVSKTMLYLQCYKHRQACQANILTNYTDEIEKYLRVIHRNGTNNHVPMGGLTMVIY